VEGRAGTVLVAATHQADLLVVGSRGLGGLRSLFLGSVSQQVAHQASCPI
jgi:nucleotide-binding universal stress UspA family protein